MRYGFYLPTRGQTASPEALETLVTRGEALGFSSVMIADHVVFPVTIKSKYPYTVSGRLSRAGRRARAALADGLRRGQDAPLRLITQRDDPAVPQPGGDRQDARHHRRALAWARHGRRRGGLAARGVRGARRARLRPARRGERRVPAHLQDAVDPGPGLVPRASSIASTRSAACPHPVQKPHPPIWVGGHSKAALRRVGAPRRRLASGRRQPRRARCARPSCARSLDELRPPHRGGGARSLAR